jgi:hypothetical protein
MSHLIAHNWDVPKRFRERLGRQAGRQRLMHEQGHLLLVLHEAPEPPRYARQHRIYWRSPDGAWQSSEKGGMKALVAHLERHAKAVDALAERLSAARSAADYFEALAISTPLARTVRNTARVVAEARDVVPADTGLLAARDIAYEADREAELVHQRARDGLEYAQAQANEAQARQAADMLAAAHRLNMLAAVFFPVTAVATIFGMQLSHGLEHLAAPWLFWLVVVLAFGLGLIVRSSVARPHAVPSEERPMGR